MNDARLVCGGKRFGDLDHDLQHQLQRDRFFWGEVLAKGLALDKFGGDIIFAVDLADLVDRENIWMIQGRCRFGLLDETA